MVFNIPYVEYLLEGLMLKKFMFFCSSWNKKQLIFLYNLLTCTLCSG